MLEDLNKYLSNNMGECKPLIQVQTCATKRVDREIHHSVVGRCRGRNRNHTDITAHTSILENQVK